jgi:multicomponent Na+:H+ antiporter subunit G
MTLPETIVEIASWVLILSGSVFAVIGAFGTVRFPDFWSRLHAMSITDSAAVILLTLGMCLQAGFTLVTVKLLIIWCFLFVTGPTASHAVANAALISGLRPKAENKDKAAKPRPPKFSNPVLRGKVKKY